MKKPKVNWISVKDTSKPLYTGLYYVAAPMNPIEGCISNIAYFNGKNWLIDNTTIVDDEVVAWAEISMPENDYEYDWRKV